MSVKLPCLHEEWKWEELKKNPAFGYKILRKKTQRGRGKEKGIFQTRWKEEEKCPTAAEREEAKTKQSCIEVNGRARARVGWKRCERRREGCCWMNIRSCVYIQSNRELAEKKKGIYEVKWLQVEMSLTVILAAVVGFSALSSCYSGENTTRPAITTADLSQVKFLDLLLRKLTIYCLMVAFSFNLTLYINSVLY